jgi:uncharacterized protein YbjT (DUF2867 family)
MDVLVVGGTGTVGRLVVQELLTRGARPRVLTRSREKAAALGPNVVGAVGDAGTPASLPPALEGIAVVVLITALGPRETAEGQAVVEAARQAGVARLVFLSVHEVERCPGAPHFRAKIEIQKAIEASGLAWTTVMPNHFFQNDLWFREAMMEHGVYPSPFGEVGLSRVDARDIGEAMATAALESGHEEQRYPLVGPAVLTAPQTAAIWSRYLRREVRYAGNDLEAWARRLKGQVSDEMIADLRVMYAYFQEKGVPASQADLRQQGRLLKHVPRRFEDFVSQTAAAWRS